MARRIVWTERASNDLRDIVLYLKERNPDAAWRVGQGFYRRVGVLADFPELGSVLKEIGGGRYRKLLFMNWKIVYEVRMDEDVVLILRLWHTSRGDLEI
jgi:toxin ParE1/3/4